MENKAEYKYLTIPHSLIQRIYTHPKTSLSDIIIVGIYKTSTYRKIDIDNVVTQLMYCYFRNKDELTPFLEDILDQLYNNGGIIEDEDHSFFSTDGKTFSIDKEYTEGLYSAIKDDDDIKEQATRWYQIRQTLSFFGMKISVTDLMGIAEQILSELPEGKALVTVKIDMITEYRGNKKTNYEIDMLACYLGMRSKLGKKVYCWTTKDEILRRMIGCTNKNDLTSILEIPELKKVYDYYSSSKYKRLTKMLEVMEVRKFFSRIPTKQRKTYISTTLNDLELAKAITIDSINKEVEEESFRHRKNIISRNITRLTDEGVKKELDRNIQTMNTKISKELQ